MSFPAPERDHFVPGPVSGADVTVERMYYTLCRLCGALSDWADTAAEAQRNRREHLKKHNQSAEIATAEGADR